MNRFYEKLNIPKNCIVDNTVFKKAFLENADLLSFDKKIINEHIKKVTWKYYKDYLKEKCNENKQLEDI